MYYRDLELMDDGSRAIGWLDPAYPFHKGTVPNHICDFLLKKYFSLENSTRGYHESGFISPPVRGYPVEYQGKRILLGSAEILIDAENGVRFRSPNLIYHYIKDCFYLPPVAFLEAVEFNMGQKK